MLLCTSTNETPHERFFNFPRKNVESVTNTYYLPSWLIPGNDVLVRNFNKSKHEPKVEKVKVIDANES